ncbi:MAG: rhomboid family intramembrane serine protease [Acidobacteriota bacterium]
MIRRQTQGSVVCPSCGRLAGVLDRRCFSCGRPHPGLFGYAPLLARFGAQGGIGNVILWGCGLVFIVSLLVDVQNVTMDFPFGLLGPSLKGGFLLGSSGAWPVFVYGRWWTPLSAGWLHGGLIHLVFNLAFLVRFLPMMEKVLGVGRTLLVYTAGSVGGFFLSSFMGRITDPRLGPPQIQLPDMLAGAQFTLGASAALSGVVGGLLYYAQKTGQRQWTQSIGQMAIFLLLFGLLIGGIDNWAHLGGFAAGYGATALLRPLHDESPVHVAAGLGCLLLSALAIAASIVFGLQHL